MSKTYLIPFNKQKNRFGSKRDPLYKSISVNALPHRESSSVPSAVHHAAIVVIVLLLKNQQWWKASKSQWTFEGRTKEWEW